MGTNSLFSVLAFLGQQKIGSASALSGFPLKFVTHRHPHRQPLMITPSPMDAMGNSSLFFCGGVLGSAADPPWNSGRAVGAAGSTHSIADNAVVTECCPPGKATFDGRGDVNVLVVTVHCAVRCCGQSYPHNHLSCVGRRPNA
jgi:hypothetical protein